MSLFEKAIQTIEGQVRSDTFPRLVRKIRCIGEENGELILEASSPFYRRWFSDHFQDRLESVIQQISGRPLGVRIVCQEDSSQQEKGNERATTPAPTPTIQPFSTPSLKETDRQSIIDTPQSSSFSNTSMFSETAGRFNFDNFVVGDSNRLAWSAAKTVSNNPGSGYNPLFIYGGTGLGKTHLLKAIGNAIIAKNPSTNLVFRSSLDYLQEYVHTIKSGSWDEFRKTFYESCDVLLIDDVQFWAKKTETQNEFFHMFNYLHERNKQIVITSDQAPNELEGMEERLVSRFTYGLITDIQPPDLSTRIAIVKSKSSQANVAISDDLARFVAEVFPGQVRELEGCINTIALWMRIHGRPMTLAEARQHLGHRIHPPSPPVTIDLVADMVANHYRVNIQDLKSKRRHQTVAVPRQVLWFLCRSILNMEVSRIARWSQKDRSTILSGIRKIERVAKEDRFLQSDLETLRVTLQTRVRNQSNFSQ